jgi:hypothetical protein
MYVSRVRTWSSKVKHVYDDMQLKVEETWTRDTILLHGCLRIKVGVSFCLDANCMRMQYAMYFPSPLALTFHRYSQDSIIARIVSTQLAVGITAANLNCPQCDHGRFEVCSRLHKIVRIFSVHIS